MYRDEYRNRFTTVAVATHNKEITALDNDGSNKAACTYLHNHRDLEILAIKKGKAYFDIDGSTFLVERGDVVFVNPYEIHSAYTEAEFLPYAYFCMTFDMSMLLTPPSHPAFKICDNLTEGYLKFDHLIRSPEIYNGVLAMEKIFNEKKEGWEFFMSSEMFKIFGLLHENKNYTLFFDEVPKNHLFVKNVLDFIEKNFSSNITSADAAESLCYDQSYFCRLFKKNFNQSFGEYLTFFRINYAAKLLRKGSSVTDAAISSGFDNLSYFTKSFKKYKNTLPSKIKD